MTIQNPKFPDRKFEVPQEAKEACLEQFNTYTLISSHLLLLLTESNATVMADAAWKQAFEQILGYNLLYCLNNIRMFLRSSYSITAPTT
jgi:hypothetical protein